MSSNEKTFSIAFRLRRIVYEDAYVSIPVTEAVMKSEPEADGTRRLDTDKLIAEAIALGKNEAAEWCVEETQTTPHPVQQPKPEVRNALDGFYLTRAR